MSILIKILEDLNKEGKSKYNIKEIEEIINDIDAKQLYLSKFGSTLFSGVILK